MDNLAYLKPALHKRQKRRDKRLDEELIECYRTGMRSKQKNGYKNKMKRDGYEAARQRESIKFMYSGGTKHLNDNLEPLQRYLVSKVGKNWDKVYSELCGQLKKNTVSGQHVFNHLFDYVFLNVVAENKNIYCLRFGKYEILRSTQSWPKFYVNSKTGQLMKAKPITNKELRASWQS